MTKSLPPKSLVLYADDDTDDLELVSEAFEKYASVIDLVTFSDGTSLLHYLQELSLWQPGGSQVPA